MIDSKTVQEMSNVDMEFGALTLAFMENTMKDKGLTYEHLMSIREQLVAIAEYHMSTFQFMAPVDEIGDIISSFPTTTMAGYAINIGVGMYGLCMKLGIRNVLFTDEYILNRNKQKEEEQSWVGKFVEAKREAEQR